MADSNKTQVSTAEAAWNATEVAAFNEWLSTEYHASDAKTGKPLYWTSPEGTKDRKTTTDVTEYPVMRLPSAPNLGANIEPDWQIKMLHHPVARQHLADDGKTPAYKDELARVSRYAAYLVVQEVEGALKVPTAVHDAFSAWYKAYDDQVSAGLSAARQGAKLANEEKTRALGELKETKGALNAQQQRVAQMLKDGLINQELADAILGAAAAE